MRHGVGYGKPWLALYRHCVWTYGEPVAGRDRDLPPLVVLTRAFDDGRLALDNNAAERALRGVAVGRKNDLFAGSERGAERAAALYSLVESAKLNGLDPEACLRDVLGRIADHPASRLAALLPWNWRPLSPAAQVA